MVGDTNTITVTVTAEDLMTKILHGHGHPRRVRRQRREAADLELSGVTLSDPTEELPSAG